MRSRRRALLLAAVLVASVVMVAPRAMYAQRVVPAQSSSATLRSSTTEAEAGEPFEVSLRVGATGSSTVVTNPRLRTPADCDSAGPSLGVPRIGQLGAGGVTATWRVTCKRPGDADLGPAILSLNGREVTTGTTRVKITPAGRNPSRRAPQASQSDPFGGLFPGMPDIDDLFRAPGQATAPPVDKRLSLAEPAEPNAFLRATFDEKTMTETARAVVGEQVTVSIYLYTRARSFQVSDQHEPNAADFLERSLATSNDPEVHVVRVGDEPWNAQLVRKFALFPLRAGDLIVGPMSLTLNGPGLHGGGVRGGLVRASRPLHVVVTEPPHDGRPRGYSLGDVGRFSLTATVEPQTLTAGGNFAATIVLRGEGFPPQRIRMPEPAGVTWLEPDVRESLDPSDTVVAGTRTFTYIGKVQTPGRMTLGDVELPYWNPKAQAYETARASLGALTVTGTAPTPSPSSSARDPFASVAPARAAPGPSVHRGAPPTDSMLYWLALLGAPAIVVAGGSVARGLRALRQSRGEKRAGAASVSSEALGEAEKAARGGDAKAEAGAVERATVAAIEGATGVKARGLLRDELTSALERAGLAAPLAADVVSLLRRADEARYLPVAEGAAGALVADARPVLKRLTKRSV